MNPVTCPKCFRICCYAADTDGDLTTMTVVCTCKHSFNNTYLGYPKLWGTDDTYFEFVDEFRIECHQR